MVTGTKNSMDLSFKADKTNLTGKYSSELYKTNISKSTSKNEDFRNVLGSKANSKGQDTQKVDTSNESDKIDELKEKLEELEEDSKSASKDDVNSILSELLNLLAKLGINEEELKSNGEINPNILKTMLEGINENRSSNSNLSSIMEKLMELLKNDSVKDSLDEDSLKLVEKLLSNLNNTEENKDIKNRIKNLMSEISNMLEAKENQGKKILTLEEMLNKNYSQDNSESSDNNKSNNTTSKDNKEVSKEDKFLNSLIDDKDDSFDKINLFASRAGAIQNQGTDNVRGLTINKATFTNDLIKDIKFMSNNSLKELIVKVNPGNLGEITIKLVQEDGLMKANLKANSKETTALLSQNLTDIKKQLVEQNIKIDDVKIELYQDDTTFFRGQGFGRQLSEEQERSNSRNSGNSSDNGVNVEEDLMENIATNNSNIVEALV